MSVLVSNPAIECYSLGKELQSNPPLTPTCLLVPTLQEKALNVVAGDGTCLHVTIHYYHRCVPSVSSGRPGLCSVSISVVVHRFDE